MEKLEYVRKFKFNLFLRTTNNFIGNTYESLNLNFFEITKIEYVRFRLPRDQLVAA